MNRQHRRGCARRFPLDFKHQTIQSFGDHSDGLMASAHAAHRTLPISFRTVTGRPGRRRPNAPLSFRLPAHRDVAARRVEREPGPEDILSRVHVAILDIAATRTAVGAHRQGELLVGNRPDREQRCKVWCDGALRTQPPASSAL